MSVLTTTRVSAPEPNADSHTNVANVQDQAIQQQTVEGDQLQQLIQLVPQWTLVKPDRLEALLQGHLVHKVLTGFCQGFQLKYKGPRQGRIHRNLNSAFQHPKLLQQHLDKEITAGRMLGPFKKIPLPNLICSPMGMVPKKDSAKMRMITHLNYPHGNSINSYMDPQDTSTSYQSFNQALVIVAKYGCGVYMSKGNIESAFRIIPIAPEDWHLLGICFNKRYFVDICLTFRASISCAIFRKVGDLLQWIAQKRAKHPISRYLDDFFTAHIL